MSAKRVVMSISTFAWWAAFLGDADAVVYPEWGILRRSLWEPTPGHVITQDLRVGEVVLALPAHAAAALLHEADAELSGLLARGDGQVLRTLAVVAKSPVTMGPGPSAPERTSQEIAQDLTEQLAKRLAQAIAE